jgi:hypothetical protein
MNASTSIPRHVLIIASFGLVLLANTWFGETTYVGDGIGWDGRVYSELVTKFCHDPGEVFRTTQSYYLQRILPSAVVATVLKLLHLPCDDAHIISAFRWYNFTLLMAGVYIWTLISRRMEFSQRGSWISAALLFFSFPVQKQYIYFPINTDATALFVSIALFYCFLARRQKTLLLVSFVGAFCWPLAFFTGLVLAVWPLRPAKEQDPARPWLAAVATAGAIGYSLYCLLVLGVRPRPVYYVALAPLSLAITVLLLFGGFRPLLPQLGTIWNEILAALKTIRMYVLLALACALYVMLHFLGTGKDAGMIQHEVQQMAVQHLSMPGFSLLENILYFGPVMFFALYRWGAISRLATGVGFGMFVVFSVSISELALNSETRKALVFLPILVAYTVKAIEGAGLSRSLCVCTVILSLLFSKIWLLINYFPGRNADPMSFPLRMFMAHVGYLDLTSYAVYGIATVLVGFGLPLYFPQLIRSTRPIEVDKLDRPVES